MYLSFFYSLLVARVSRVGLIIRCEYQMYYQCDQDVYLYNFCKMQPDQQIQFIMKSEVGALLCKGFAKLYREKPQFPITSLANFLLAQGRKKIDLDNIQKEEVHKEQALKELRSLQHDQKQHQEKLRHVETWQDKRNALVEYINKVQYPEDLLREWLPEHIEVYTFMSGCYVGLLTYPSKRIGENDQDEKGHLDLEAPKIISYVGSSKSNANIMLGKVLPADKGITAQIFKIQEEVPGDDQENKKPKQKYIYVPNVLKQQKTHFFRLPKLGSYAAFPLILKNFLTQQAFEKGVEQQKRFLLAKEQAEKERSAKLNELKLQVEEVEKKEDETLLQAEEFLNIKNQYETLLSKSIEVGEPNFQFIKKQYVICCDRLGQDKQIEHDVLLKVQDLVNTFNTIYQKREKQYLLKDIENYNAYLASLDGTTNQISQHIHEQMEAQGTSSLASLKQKFTDEKQLAYELECVKLNKLKKLFADKYRKHLKTYAHFHIGKFRNVMQTLLIFAGYDKKQINVAETNQLDWRKIQSLIEPGLAQFVLKYNHRGVKPAVANGYARISKMLEKFQKVELQPILNFNVALWCLTRIVKISLHLRITGRDILVDKFENKKKERNLKIEEKAKIQQDRNKALDAHRLTLEGQALQQFNEAEWLANYNSEHPIPEIPEEPELEQYVDI